MQCFVASGSRLELPYFLYHLFSLLQCLLARERLLVMVIKCAYSCRLYDGMSLCTVNHSKSCHLHLYLGSHPRQCCHRLNLQRCDRIRNWNYDTMTHTDMGVQSGKICLLRNVLFWNANIRLRCCPFSLFFDLTFIY